MARTTKNDGLEISWTTEDEEQTPSVSLRMRVRGEYVEVRMCNEKSSANGGRSTWTRVYLPFDEWDRIVAFIEAERARVG